MKPGWKTKTLSELGSAARDSIQVFPNIEYELWSVPSFADDEPEIAIGKEIGSAKLRVTPNDVLICKINPRINRVWLVRDPIDGRDQIASTEWLVFRTNPNASLLPNWLIHFVSAPKFREWIVSDVSGATGSHTRAKADGILRQQIPVPPLPEQRRIVGILDEVFAGIAAAKANAERNLQNARALFESHLHAVLRSKKWKWKTLGDLCDGVEYGSSTKSKREGKVPVLRMGNIQDGQLNWENLVYMVDEVEIAKYLLKHNDVLFNRTNSPELVGKTAIYKSEMPAIFAGYLIRINRNEDLLDGDYLNYFLNSQIALDYGKTVVISSVNQANINGAKLKGYPIPAPSISEQRGIVKQLDGLQEEIQRLESLYQRKLAALDELKKSLLHQAFNGQL